MHGPAVVSWLLVVMCGATGVYCLRTAARAAGAPPGGARVEGVMGLAMAAMALPVRPAGALSEAAFAVFFGALAAAALWSARPVRAGRAGGRHRWHGLHHALEALAMAYMAVVMAAAGGGQHAGHGAGPGGVPVLTGALLAYFAGFALYTGARLAPAAAVPVTAPAGSGAGALGRLPPAAGMAPACRLTLALSSFTMLLTV